MTDERHDDDLARLMRTLRELPREEASAAFVTHVMEAVEPPRRSLGLPAFGLLAATLLVALLAATLRPGAPAADTQRRALEDIVQEYSQLQAEWQALQGLRAAARPVVYLGGTDGTDLVLDLEQWARLRAASRAAPAPDARIQPAAFSQGEHLP